MADKENLFPLQVKWVAVPLADIQKLDGAQRWCRDNYDTDEQERNTLRASVIDEFLDVPEVKRALENHG